jgi:hypothetical protein
MKYGNFFIVKYDIVLSKKYAGRKTHIGGLHGSQVVANPLSYKNVSEVSEYKRLHKLLHARVGRLSLTWLS